MPRSTPHPRLPQEMQVLRSLAQGTILGLLWLLPLGLAWLAERSALAWELVTLLGTAVALVATHAWRRGQPGGRAVLAGAVAVGCALLAGTGHNLFPAATAHALSCAALLLAGLLCDGRALTAAFWVALGQTLLSLGGNPPHGVLLQVAMLLALSAAILLVQVAARRALGSRPAVHVSARPPCAPVWAPPRDGFPFRGVLVQAERSPDGTLRMAVAGPATGRVRVTIQ